MPEQTEKLSPLSGAEKEDFFRGIAIDCLCQETGNTWFPESAIGRGKSNLPVIVQADYEGVRYTSSGWGRAEMRCAFALSKMRQTYSDPAVSLRTSAIGLTEEQIDAISLVKQNRISMISGGPGTGKTTVCKYIAESHKSVIGLSPTGKGASRLSESIGKPCYTIHMASRLGIDLGEYDLVVIDECSMLGTDVLNLLLSSLFKAQSKILFVGDSGQLPSVSPGLVFDNLHILIPSVSLSINKRSDDMGIGMACAAAKAGFVHNSLGAYSLVEKSADSAVIGLYHDMSKIFGTMETRIICLDNESVSSINRSLTASSFGDIPVVCTKNNYEHGIFNGDTGRLIRGSSRLIFSKSGQDIEVSAKKISWSWAYASTCHKAQGGQWESVIVWIPSPKYITREWLNTAMSRARKNLILVCPDAERLQASITANGKRNNRVSLLAALSRGQAKWVS